MTESYWQRTQQLLQSGDDPLVRRPKLTGPLLQRPPFRFLHDVVSEVSSAAASFLGPISQVHFATPSELRQQVVCVA